VSGGSAGSILPLPDHRHRERWFGRFEPAPAGPPTRGCGGSAGSNLPLPDRQRGGAVVRQGQVRWETPVFVRPTPPTRGAPLGSAGNSDRVIDCLSPRRCHKYRRCNKLRPRVIELVSDSVLASYYRRKIETTFSELIIHWITQSLTHYKRIGYYNISTYEE